MKKLFSNLYILGFMAVTVVLTITIWKLTFGHIVDEYQSRKRSIEVMEKKEQQKKEKEQVTFQKAILDSGERVRHYLGYRVLEEEKLEGHFHHIDFDFIPDKRSYCIECHGDLPHDKVKELRAFTNMHASFIACQTCHVKSNSDGTKIDVFKWYDRTSGEIVDSPVRKGIRPGTYRAKIFPFERSGGELQRIDTKERMDFAREYRKNEVNLSDVQKSKAKSMIHQIVSKKPYVCEDCHQKEASILPFRDLGYSQQRIDAFVGTEVVGMIRNYTEFYMPRILHPGFTNEDGAGGPKKTEG